MKLAILGTRGIPARYGGFETFAEELAVRLVRQGISVTVYCDSIDSERPKIFKGVTLRSINAPKFGPLTTVIFDLLCLLDAKKNFNIVYMLGYGASLFCFIPRLWGKTVWINMDGIEWARSKWGRLVKIYFKIMEAIALRTANRVIADAEGVKQFLERRHGSDIACTVIPYGSQIVQHASLDLLDAFSAKPYAYYLIVCRLEPENHLFEIMKGFAASHSKYSLIIVGNHLGRSKYVQKLASIQNVRIKFVGTVYDKDKLQSLRYYCKAYFHGHSVGGTNPSLLEALGCGNVVIAHDNAFNREVAGDLGFYFRTDNDVTRFVEMMDVMDDNTRKQLSASAQKRIIDNYTWESVTDKYLSLLQSYYPS